MLQNVSDVWLSNSFAQQSVPPRDGGLRKFLIVSNALLLVLLIAQLGFYLGIAPRLYLENIEIHGSVESREGLLSYLGLDQPILFFALDEKVLLEKILTIPEIRSASVQTRFPNTVIITLDKRQAVGIVLHPETNQMYLVDREGVVFSRNVSARLDYPLISGLSWEENHQNPVLSKNYIQFLDDLYLIKTQDVTLYDLISEVKVQSLQSGFSLMLSFIHNKIKVLLPPRLEIATLKQALLFLDLLQMESLDQTVDELDMRTPTAVFRKIRRGS